MRRAATAQGALNRRSPVGRRAHSALVAKANLTAVAGQGCRFVSLLPSTVREAGLVREKVFAKDWGRAGVPGKTGHWFASNGMGRQEKFAAASRLWRSSPSSSRGRQCTKKGTFIVGVIVSANRDETVFEDPDRSDVPRHTTSSSTCESTTAPARVSRVLRRRPAETSTH